jgi:hypothetical protein
MYDSDTARESHVSHHDETRVKAGSKGYIKYSIGPAVKVQ